MPIVDAGGCEVHRCAVEHSAAGLRELLGAGITVVVISPNQVKNLRGRYGSAGNKDDRFDCQDRADWLTPKRLATWLSGVGYSGRADPAVLYARLTAAPRGAGGDDGSAHAHITRALRTLVEQIKLLTEQIGKQLAGHADAHIMTSLPRSGTVRAARPLAEIGDCRARFPTPESLACLVGVARSARQSGNARSVGFHWAADKQLFDGVTDFAGDSRHSNLWAADLYNRAVARGHDYAHAVRILARAWPFVIWHCWQDNLAYEPDKHGASKE